MWITITAKEGRKIVEQFDVDLPSWARWIAQDEDGWWCGYKTKPKIKNYSWVGWPWHELKLDDFVPNPDWRDTLIKVADIK